MKAVVLLAVFALALCHMSDARMNVFSCSGDCFSYLEGPFCISNGSVVCDNCVRDAMLCADLSLTSETCSDACD